MSDQPVEERLEELRAALRAENISYGELAELQGLAEHIKPGDVELLEAAGVPEFPERQLKVTATLTGTEGQRMDLTYGAITDPDEADRIAKWADGALAETFPKWFGEDAEIATIEVSISTDERKDD